MFPNAILYRLTGDLPSTADLEEALTYRLFLRCGPAMERSGGWVPPRGDAEGAMVESIGGQLILAYQVQTKTVPGHHVKAVLAERIAAIEKATGRKPGRRETKDLKEDVLLQLLPHAFPKTIRTLVWIDRAAQLLLIAASTVAKADDVVSALVQAIQGLGVSMVRTNTSATAGMATWLAQQEAPAGFSIDRDCALEAADDSGAAIRYTHHALDIDEVRQHIAHGKLPTSLAMTWDERVHFTLTEGMQLKGIKFLDGVMDQPQRQGQESGFDADVAIVTGELQRLIPDLLEALGGEVLAQAPTGQLFTGQEPGATIDGAGNVLVTLQGRQPANDADELYPQAVAVIQQHQRANISLIQRVLKIGYNRAARLLEDMERAGLVSPMAADGSRTLRVAA